MDGRLGSGRNGSIAASNSDVCMYGNRIFSECFDYLCSCFYKETAMETGIMHWKQKKATDVVCSFRILSLWGKYDLHLFYAGNQCNNFFPARKIIESVDDFLGNGIW